MIRILLFLILLTPSIFSDTRLVEACLDFELSFQKENKEKIELLQKSAHTFETVISENKTDNPYLEFNLGTIYLYLEDFGKAILHLKKAHKLEPNDNRIVSNLMRAGRITNTPLFAKEDNDFFNVFIRYWSKTSLVFWQCGTILISILILIKVCISKKNSLNAKIVYSTIILIFGLCVFLKNGKIGDVQEIVLLHNYNPKSGFGKRYPDVLPEPLIPGACGTIKRMESDWAEIKWHGGFSGWVPQSKIAIVENIK